MYDATGLATSGTLRPSSCSRSRGPLTAGGASGTPRGSPGSCPGPPGPAPTRPGPSCRGSAWSRARAPARSRIPTWSCPDSRTTVDGADRAAARRHGANGRGRGSVDRRLGLLADLVLGDVRCELDQGEALLGDVEHAQVGDDPVDHAATGVGQRALLDDLVGPVLGHVLHEHDDPL